MAGSMYINRAIPLRIANTKMVPDRIEGEDRRLTRAGNVMTYNIMTENSVSIQELSDMGVCIMQVLMLWGEAPGAQNLNFHGLQLSGLVILTKAIRNEVIGARFPQLSWFSMGLGVKELLHLKPKFDVLKTFRVTAEQLIANNAHDQGSNWQLIFGWNEQQWSELGFDRESLARHVAADKTASKDMKKRRLQWGPPQLAYF